MNSQYKYDFENQHQNGNGDILKSICKQVGVLIVNGLKGNDFSYDHSLTYCKKKERISRLDFCLASVNLTTLIESFSVVQDDKLPSDHAIIACSIKSRCNLEYEQLSKQFNTKSSLLIEKISAESSKIKHLDARSLAEKILTSESSKRTTYHMLNPLLENNKIYGSTDIPEYSQQP